MANARKDGPVSVPVSARSVGGHSGDGPTASGASAAHSGKPGPASLMGGVANVASSGSSPRPLSEIRRSVGLTQAEVAATLNTGQGSISKIEHASDMYLSTLRKYVTALGGELKLVAVLGDGRALEIRQTVKPDGE